MAPGPAPLILIVDDDPDLCEALVEVLADRGYRAVVAANGREALDRLHAPGPRPAAILLDLMMPVMDGWAFRDAQLAEPALAGIPVVVLTAQGNVTPPAPALVPAALLRKPVPLTLLLETLARLLRD